MKEWVTGRNPVYEVLRANRRKSYRLYISQNSKLAGRLLDIKILADSRQIKTELVQKDELSRIQNKNQGVALEVDEYPYCSIYDIFDTTEQRKEPAFILILDSLQDPQNFGTLLRTADAVGIHGVIMPSQRSSMVTPAVVSASAGASEVINIAMMNLNHAISMLKERNIWVVGLENRENAVNLPEVELTGPLGLVVGSEGHGIRELIRRNCDVLLELPSRGQIGSLNASTAGSIGLYFAWCARGYSGAN